MVNVAREKRTRRDKESCCDKELNKIEEEDSNE